MPPSKSTYQFRLQLPEAELRMLAWLAQTRQSTLGEVIHSLIREAHARESTRVEGRLEAYAERLESTGAEDEARRVRATVENLKAAPGGRRRRLFVSSSGGRAR